MDIHRKLRERRRRARQMRQQRRLAQQPNVRELKQRRRRAGRVTKSAGPETGGRRAGTPNVGSSTHD